MAKRFHCTGPIEVAIRVAAQGPGPALSFGTGFSGTGGQVALGTCEQHPVVDGDVLYDQVPNDIAGTQLGLDKQFQGSTEIILLDLNRFDYAVLSLLESFPCYGRTALAPFDSPGFNDWLDRGAYLQQNGLSFELWLYFTFFGTRVASAYPLMPRGIYYPCCNLLKDSIPKQGLKTQTKRLAVEANWAWFEPEGSFFLKTSDPSYF